MFNSFFAKRFIMTSQTSLRPCASFGRDSCRTYRKRFLSLRPFRYHKDRCGIGGQSNQNCHAIDDSNTKLSAC
jgi:hypothetical protein